MNRMNNPGFKQKKHHIIPEQTLVCSGMLYFGASWKVGVSF